MTRRQHRYCAWGATRDVLHPIVVPFEYGDRSVGIRRGGWLETGLGIGRTPSVTAVGPGMVRCRIVHTTVDDPLGHPPSTRWTIGGVTVTPSSAVGSSISENGSGSPSTGSSASGLSWDLLALSASATLAMMLVTKTNHAVAYATTLLIALGLIAGLVDGGNIVVAVATFWSFHDRVISPLAERYGFKPRDARP